MISKTLSFNTLTTAFNYVRRVKFKATPPGTVFTQGVNEISSNDSWQSVYSGC